MMKDELGKVRQRFIQTRACTLEELIKQQRNWLWALANFEIKNTHIYVKQGLLIINLNKIGTIILLIFIYTVLLVNDN